MLREEFENRMGNTVTPEAYEDIEDLYISAGDIDKDTFCDDYKLHGASKILTEIWKRYKITRDALKIYKKEHQAAAEMLVKLSNDYDIVEAEDLARTMINDRGVIRYKLEHGIALTSEEKAFILEKI